MRVEGGGLWLKIALWGAGTTTPASSLQTQATPSPLTCNAVVRFSMTPLAQQAHMSFRLASRVKLRVAPGRAQREEKASTGTGSAQNTVRYRKPCSCSAASLQTRRRLHATSFVGSEDATLCQSSGRRRRSGMSPGNWTDGSSPGFPDNPSIHVMAVTCKRHKMWTCFHARGELALVVRRLRKAGKGQLRKEDLN